MRQFGGAWNSPNDACNFYDQDDESPLHLILQCPCAISVWLLLADWSDSPAPAAHAQEAINIKEWWNEMNALASWAERLLLHKSTPTRPTLADPLKIEKGNRQNKL